MCREAGKIPFHKDPRFHQVGQFGVICSCKRP
jgi:hypothetical protein